VPAAAVIPAPAVYTNIAAVKKLVVDRRAVGGVWVLLAGLNPPAGPRPPSLAKITEVILLPRSRHPPRDARVPRMANAVDSCVRNDAGVGRSAGPPRSMGGGRGGYREQTSASEAT